MEVFGYGVGAHKARIAKGAIAGALLIAGACTASAQTSGANSADKAPSEAAMRAAASPFRFILQNAKAPARKPVAAPKAVEAPAVAEPRHPAAPPVQQASVQTSAPVATSAPAAPAVAPPPPAPASEPAVAALSRQSLEPPPPKRDIIPIRTDEPHLSPALLREQPHGIVKVEFDIQPDGSVGDVKVLSSTNRVLNRPTVDAVQAWKFQPVDEILTVQTEVDYKLDQ
jgi:TonB family protein